jgi:hypothetical protein
MRDGSRAHRSPGSGKKPIVIEYGKPSPLQLSGGVDCAEFEPLGGTFRINSLYVPLHAFVIYWLNSDNPLARQISDWCVYALRNPLCFERRRSLAETCSSEPLFFANTHLPKTMCPCSS